MMFNDYCAYNHVITIFILLSRFLMVNKISMFVPLVFSQFSVVYIFAFLGIIVTTHFAIQLIPI